ncbi:MAG: EF-hand domain-containing protein [Lysobacterales bacterium]
MKRLKKTVFAVIPVTAAIFALTALPLAAHAGQGMQHKPPPFAAMDKDSDGFVSEEEFNSHRAERQAAMAEAGKPMKGMATAPTFADIDTDSDGKLSEAELTAAQQAHKQAMHEAHKGMGGGKEMHKGMKMPTFGDLDLDGDGCINAEEFAKHEAEMHR